MTPAPIPDAPTNEPDPHLAKLSIAELVVGINMHLPPGGFTPEYDKLRELERRATEAEAARATIAEQAQRLADDAEYHAEMQRCMASFLASEDELEAKLADAKLELDEAHIYLAARGAKFGETMLGRVKTLVGQRDALRTKLADAERRAEAFKTAAKLARDRFCLTDDDFCIEHESAPMQPSVGGLDSWVAKQLDEVLADTVAKKVPGAFAKLAGAMKPHVDAMQAAVAAPPDQGASARLREAAQALLRYAERNECPHDETHRGGSIWTICDRCGRKWADDTGGFQPYEEPEVFEAVRAALAAEPATPGAQSDEAKRDAVIDDIDDDPWLHEPLTEREKAACDRVTSAKLPKKAAPAPAEPAAPDAGKSAAEEVREAFRGGYTIDCDNRAQNALCAVAAQVDKLSERVAALEVRK